MTIVYQIIPPFTPSFFQMFLSMFIWYHALPYLILSCSKIPKPSSFPTRKEIKCANEPDAENGSKKKIGLGHLVLSSIAIQAAPAKIMTRLQRVNNHLTSTSAASHFPSLLPRFLPRH